MFGSSDARSGVPEEQPSMLELRGSSLWHRYLDSRGSRGASYLYSQLEGRSSALRVVSTEEGWVKQTSKHGAKRSARHRSSGDCCAAALPSAVGCLAPALPLIVTHSLFTISLWRNHVFSNPACDPCISIARCHLGSCQRMHVSEASHLVESINLGISTWTSCSMSFSPCP